MKEQNIAIETERQKDRSYMRRDQWRFARVVNKALTT